MNKIAALRVVNLILTLSALLQMVTIVLFVLKIQLGGPKTVFLTHKYNGFVLAGLIVAHLALNWNWVLAQTGLGKKAKS